MAYKIKKSRDYSEEEFARLRKKYHHGELLPFSETLRIGLRKVADIPQRVHKKGNMVQYKERLARVHKVTKKGIYLETFKNKDDFLESTGKIIFVPEARVEHEVYPITTRLPVLEGITLAE